MSILLLYYMGRYYRIVVARTSISTHILHRSILVTYWYWEAGCTWTALVHTYVQVLPVCTGQSVLYRPLYRLAARHLLLGQSSGLVITEVEEPAKCFSPERTFDAKERRERPPRRYDKRG